MPSPRGLLPGRNPSTRLKALILLSLTVDVLWQKDFLDEVLAVLDERDVKAVFFITGEWLRENQQEAQKIVAYGHQLGNQTFSHSKLLLLTEEEIINEISKFNTLCQDLLNYQPIFSGLLTESITSG